MRIVGNVWVEGNSPFKTARKYGLLKLGVKRHVTGRLGIKDEAESEALIDLMYTTNLHEGSQSAIFGILAFRAYAKIPLRDKLSGLQMPVCALYG